MRKARVKRHTLSTSRLAQQGFTLLEALIALVILALSLSTLMSSYSTGLRGVATLDDRVRARLLAQTLLEELSHDRTLRPGTQSGRFDQFAWTLSTAPYEDMATPPSPEHPWAIYQMTLMVSWSRGRQLELQTLRIGRAR